MSTLSEDHAAVRIDLETETSRVLSPYKSLPPKPYNEEEVIWNREALNTFLRGLHPLDWSLDVHSHAKIIQDNLEEHLKAVAPPSRRPLRKVMSEETWQLVLTKRDARARLADFKDTQRRLVLTACFHGWHSSPTTGTADRFSDLQRQLHRQIALELHTFRGLGRLVTAAIRKDDRDFYSQLAKEGADVFDHNSSKRFWTVVRRSLPKFRQRRMAPAPLRMEGLEEQWDEYFQDLEVGRKTSATELITDCHRHQLRQWDRPTQILLEDLPSLQEVENEFRATTAYRSTGFDPVPSGLFHVCAASMARAHYDVILKQFLWQAEPVQNKGGPLIVIPKRPHATEVGHYRGIMLLPSAAKRVHAILRKRAMNLLSPLRPQGQLGGFPKQQVGFGSQPLRVYGRIMDCKGLTSGVLFVDLANAFHRLVRELVTGLTVPEDAADVIANLHQHGHATEGLCRWLELPGILTRIHAPPLLVRMLQDIHSHTWFQLAVSGHPTITKRGTRPGSPLADCIFHVLMLDVIVELNTWIQDQDQYQCILKELDITFDTVVCGRMTLLSRGVHGRQKTSSQH